ncbi:hypothetical protein Q31b_32380 [Novipirellula aureliae]|uniref:Uncharacterized protein n=1 Tax=Novipirellula aureliae TaxID=2527966 RepID=A0A5C6DTB3_9BACT|nr:hypothetical protein Q31b_32380 [Novipirellula aureliae]
MSIKTPIRNVSLNPLVYVSIGLRDRQIFVPAFQHNFTLGLETFAVWALPPVFPTEPWQTPAWLTVIDPACQDRKQDPLPQKITSTPPESTCDSFEAY